MAKKKQEEKEIKDPSAKMTLSELESFLFKVADKLRKSISSEQYKSYILGFLFLKRMNDVFKEEREELTKQMKEEGKGQSIIDVQLEKPSRYKKSFYIPSGARWDDLKHIKKSIGEKLNQAMYKIEEVPENSRLSGILTSIDFANQDLGDSVIEEILGLYDAKNLGYSNLEDPDALGLAYEYLIKTFADNQAKEKGSFFTPRPVVKLLVELLDVQPNQSIYDPTCGTGGILLQALASLHSKIDDQVKLAKTDAQKKELKKQRNNISLKGQELIRETWLLAKMNFLLHDIHDFEIEKGDVLRDPKFVKNGRLMTFDRVMANPPYSQEWYNEIYENDPYNRFTYGLPQQGKQGGDFAFVMQIIKSMNETGRAGVVLPHGPLFRSGAESKIRQGLIDDDKIEAIVGLPSNIFYGTPIATVIIIFNNNKPKALKNKVLFINAENLFSEGKPQNFMAQEHIDEVVNVYKDKKEVKRFSKIVSAEEIKKNGYNLNIKKYADTSLPPEIYDVQGILTGGIPQSELDHEHNKETLEGVDLSKILEKKNGRYYFIKDSKNIEDKLTTDQLGIINRWREKYSRPLSEIQKESKELMNKLSQNLKELGYE